MNRKSVIALPALQDNYIWVIPGNGNEIAVVDPGSAEVVLDYCQKEDKRLTAIFCTHHHADHTAGNLILQNKFSAPIYGSLYDEGRIAGISKRLKDGDRLRWCDYESQIIEIPGHTLGHIAYYFPLNHWLFAGDTLFSMGCGRLFEGSPRQMLASLTKLSQLPSQTLIYSGHEYSQKNAEFALTLEPENSALQYRYQEVLALRKVSRPTLPVTLDYELKTNPFLRCHLPHMQKIAGHSDLLPTFTEIRARKDQY